MRPHCKDKVSSLVRTSLHHPILNCVCTAHVAQSTLACLWEADCWIRVWAPSVWRLGGSLLKVLEWQLPKKKCWNQLFTSLLISLLFPLGSFVCQWGYQNLDLNHYWTIWTFLSKLLHLHWACPWENPENPWENEWDPAKQVNTEWVSRSFT